MNEALGVTTKARARVLQDVINERIRQEQKYSAEHDDEHSIDELCGLIQQRLDNADYVVSYAAARAELVKAAALTVATIEMIDRNGLVPDAAESAYEE